jgi:hypothetical protein
MNNKYFKNMLTKPNVYTPWLSQFTKPKGPAPKKPSNAQVYMHHPNYIEKFTVEFDHQVEDKGMPATLQLNLRNKVAQELFCQELQVIQESLCQENQDAHDELTAEYGAALKGAPPVDQEGQDQ